MSANAHSLRVARTLPAPATKIGGNENRRLDRLFLLSCSSSPTHHL